MEITKKNVSLQRLFRTFEKEMEYNNRKHEKARKIFSSISKFLQFSEWNISMKVIPKRFEGGRIAQNYQKIESENYKKVLRFW